MLLFESNKKHPIVERQDGYEHLINVYINATCNIPLFEVNDITFPFCEIGDYISHTYGEKDRSCKYKQRSEKI